MSKYLDLSLVEINELLKSKKIKPKDLVLEAFDRIEANKDLNAFITLDKEGALNTEGNFAIPETITIDASKCTSELQKLKRQLDTISRFKFQKHIPNFKIDSDSLSDDSDYDDNLSSYRENIHGLFMSTFEILLEGSIKLIHKALDD